MNYKSGDVIFTEMGAFLFVNKPSKYGSEDKIVLINLFILDSDGTYLSNRDHAINKEWLQTYGEQFTKINLHDMLHQMWPAIKKELFEED